MKVLMINGSRKDDGCTFTALTEISKVLKDYSIESEILNVGKQVFNGNIEEVLESARQKIKTSDAIIVGSPVYYASPSGEVLMFLDRFFASAGADLRYKPASSISTCRRAGNTATLDVLNKYFSYNSMPIISSCYWNEVHGKTPEDVLKDKEGLQILRNLGKNMAWILKSIEAGKTCGVEQPTPEDKIFTNFIN